MRHLTPAEIVLQDLGVVEPSEIDMEAIAIHLGATVKYRLLDGCEASIIGYGDKAVITVRPDTRRERQCFSIGHELGHWQFQRGKPLFCQPEDIGNYAHGPFDPEHIADRYAADLLMPRYLFEPMASKQPKMTFDATEELAGEFNTSLTATAIRFVELGPAPAMVVCHGRDGRKWFRRGTDVPEYFYPRRDLDPDSFAHDVLYGDKRKTGAHKVDADAWIDRWNADRFEVVEQTVRIGEGEILTMIWWQDESQIEDALKESQRSG